MLDGEGFACGVAGESFRRRYLPAALVLRIQEAGGAALPLWWFRWDDLLSPRDVYLAEDLPKVLVSSECQDWSFFESWC